MYLGLIVPSSDWPNFCWAFIVFSWKLSNFYADNVDTNCENELQTDIIALDDEKDWWIIQPSKKQQFLVHLHIFIDT